MSLTSTLSPSSATIDKAMGNDRVQERYEYDINENILSYHFVTKEGSDTHKMYTNTLFTFQRHAYLPVSFSILSKSSTQLQPNFTILSRVRNHWDYVEEPSVKNTMLQKISSTTEMIPIGGATVEATHYKLWQEKANYNFNKKKKKGMKPLRPLKFI